MCVHDKDVDEQNEGRKPHVHLVLIVLKYDYIQSCASSFQVALGIRQLIQSGLHWYQKHLWYLIHNTESCEKKNKHRYSQRESQEAGFDIGFYEQVSASEKQMLRNVCFIIDNKHH